MRIRTPMSAVKSLHEQLPRLKWNHLPYLPKDQFRPAEAPTAAQTKRDVAAYGSCGDVLTQHNDKARTGAATCESVLSPAAVASGNFGKLYSRTVDGQVYAQPLYVSNVAIGDGAPVNVLLVATMSNNLYAFDADDVAASKPLWTVNLGPAVPAKDYGAFYADADGSFGVLGTPTIDKDKGIVYVVTALKQGDGDAATYTHALNAIDLTDGKPVLGGPVPITGAVAGTSSDAVDGVLSFDSLQHIQRPGLLLDKGQIVVAFGSHGDGQPYHGWIMSYDASTLQQTGVFSSTVASQGGSVWQSGQGIAVGDDGSLYAATANGFDTDATRAEERAQSLLRLELNPGVQLADYFTPANYAALSDIDADFGSSGPTVIPGSGRVLTGGKGGVLYNVAQTDLGKLTPTDAGTQELKVSEKSLYGAPVYWKGTAEPQVFIWPAGDTLRSYTFVDGQLSTEAAQRNAEAISEGGVPGGVLAVSADGDTANSGVLWANLVLSGNANQKTQAGVLKAYNASNLNNLLWSSEAAPRDSFGNLAKFTPPTIANGRVYMATFSNQVVAYGLLANVATNSTATNTAAGTGTATSIGAGTGAAGTTATGIGGGNATSSLPGTGTGVGTTATDIGGGNATSSLPGTGTGVGTTATGIGGGNATSSLPGTGTGVGTTATGIGGGNATSSLPGTGTGVGTTATGIGGGNATSPMPGTTATSLGNGTASSNSTRVTGGQLSTQTITLTDSNGSVTTVTSPCTPGAPCMPPPNTSTGNGNGTFTGIGTGTGIGSGSITPSQNVSTRTLTLSNSGGGVSTVTAPVTTGPDGLPTPVTSTGLQNGTQTGTQNGTRTATLGNNVTTRTVVVTDPNGGVSTVTVPCTTGGDGLPTPVTSTGFQNGTQTATQNGTRTGTLGDNVTTRTVVVTDPNGGVSTVTVPCTTGGDGLPTPVTSTGIQNGTQTGTQNSTRTGTLGNNVTTRTIVVTDPNGGVSTVTVPCTTGGNGLPTPVTSTGIGNDTQTATQNGTRTGTLGNNVSTRTVIVTAPDGGVSTVTVPYTTGTDGAPTPVTSTSLTDPGANVTTRTVVVTDPNGGVSTVTVPCTTGADGRPTPITTSPAGSDTQPGATTATGISGNNGSTRTVIVTDATGGVSTVTVPCTECDDGPTTSAGGLPTGATNLSSVAATSAAALTSMTPLFPNVTTSVLTGTLGSSSMASEVRTSLTRSFDANVVTQTVTNPVQTVTVTNPVNTVTLTMTLTQTIVSTISTVYETVTLMGGCSGDAGARQGTVTGATTSSAGSTAAREAQASTDSVAVRPNANVLVAGNGNGAGNRAGNRGSGFSDDVSTGNAGSLRVPTPVLSATDFAALSNVSDFFGDYTPSWTSSVRPLSGVSSDESPAAMSVVTVSTTVGLPKSVLTVQASPTGAGTGTAVGASPTPTLALAAVLARALRLA